MPIKAKLEVVLLTRDRPELAKVCISAIIPQLTEDVHFWISDNSVYSDSTDHIAKEFSNIPLLRRGGSLSQFEHMSLVFSEVSATHAVLMHDDDMFSPFLISMMLEYVSLDLSYGVLLNRVNPTASPCSLKKLQRFQPYRKLSLRQDNKFNIINDYLTGCVSGEYYSISMTLFNVQAARSELHVLLSTGLYADAAFILSIAHNYGHVYNTTPSGLYYLGPTSISFTSNFLQIRKFTNFLFSHSYFSSYSEKIGFYKFRYRINMYSKYKQKRRVNVILLLTGLYYLSRPKFAFCIYRSLFNRVIRKVLGLLSSLRIGPHFLR